MTPRLNGPSPWGRIQTANRLADGIVMVTTAGHGGIWLDDAHEDAIPAHIRAIAREYAPAHWYEEDCDISIPVTFYPDAFGAATVAAVRKYAESDPRYEALRNR